MRAPLLLLLALGSVGIAACGTGPAVSITPGVSGAPLASTLSVRVVDETRAHAPIAGASVDVGGTAVTTDANGAATLTTSAASVTLTVRKDGYVTERWIGVDRSSVIVALALPLVPRDLHATITGGSGDMLVSATTTLSILRVSTPGGSAVSCPGGACVPTLSVQSRFGVDVVLVDATSARIVPDVMTDASGHFAIDVASIRGSERLVTLSVTIPTGAGLASVVGVPGIATTNGVALLPSPRALTMTTTTATARDGPLAAERLWYVVRGTTADGFGESMMFDRDVAANGVVTLAGSFLAVPTATASGMVSITVDPAVRFYVVEVYAGATASRALVLHPSGARIDVPIDLRGASSVVVRAIDAPASPGGQIDLVAAEAAATRVATLQL